MPPARRPPLAGDPQVREIAVEPGPLLGDSPDRWHPSRGTGQPLQPANRVPGVGDRAQQDAARPQHPGAFAQYGSRGADVLQDARREDRVEAGRREWQRPPVGVELDPLGGGRGIGGRGLAQHVGRDVATGHPQPRASQMPGQFAGAAAEIKHPPSAWDVVPDRIGQLGQPTGEPAIRRVLGGPTARLGVKEQLYLLRVVQRLLSHDRPPLPRPGWWRASWPA